MLAIIAVKIAMVTIVTESAGDVLPLKMGQ